MFFMSFMVKNGLFSSLHVPQRAGVGDYLESESKKYPPFFRRVFFIFQLLRNETSSFRVCFLIIRSFFRKISIISRSKSGSHLFRTVL